MSETTTTTEPTTEPVDDQEKNWRRMEERIKALEAENSELRPFRDRDLVRNAGFDPDTGEGKSLIRDLGSGTVTPVDGEDLPAAIKRFAESEYGWKPRPVPTPVEQEQARAAQQQQRLASVSTSTDLTPEGELMAQMNEARDSGDYALAARLERRLKAQQEGKG